MNRIVAVLLISTSISIAGCALYTERDEQYRGRPLGHDAILAERSSMLTSPKKQVLFEREIVYEYNRFYIDKSGNIVLAADYEESGDFHQGLAYVKIDGKYGYIDNMGELVIQSQFDYAHDFANGLASVMVSDRWGFIDQKGEYTIEPTFDFASNFGDGLAPVKIGEKFGYVGIDGQVRIQPTFDYAYSFSEGRAVVLFGEVVPIRGGLSFYFPNVERKVIDTSGKIVTHTALDLCYKEYSDGLLAISRNGKWGYMDREGSITIDTQYDEALPFSNGFGIVRKNNALQFIARDGIILQSVDYGLDRDREVNYFNRDGNLAPFTDLNTHYLNSYGYMDIRSGQIVLDAAYDWASKFSDGLARVTVAVATESTRVTPFINGSVFQDEYGLIAFDKDGNWGFSRDFLGQEIVIEPEFDAVYPFFEECAAVMREGKWGFIDLQGNFLIDFTYDWAYPFSDGLAAVRIGEKWGFIDRRGVLVIKPTYDSAYAFSEGLAPVKVGSKWGFMNTKGRMVIDPKYNWAEPFANGFAVVVTGEAKEVDVEYGEGTPIPIGPTTYIIDGKWGFIDRHGNSLKSLQFDGAWFFGDRVAAVKVGSKWGFINRAGSMIVDPTFDNVDMSFDRRYLMVVEKGEKRKTVHTLKELLTDTQ